MPPDILEEGGFAAMHVERNKPGAGSEVRRFSAGPAAPRPGGKSFAAALKQAAEEKPPVPDVSAPMPSRPAGASPSAAPASAPEASDAPAAAAPGPGEASADTPVSFADHMEMVRYRLKTGYYASKSIEDALTEKLSGYFDDLG